MSNMLPPYAIPKTSIASMSIEIGICTNERCTGNFAAINSDIATAGKTMQAV